MIVAAGRVEPAVWAAVALLAVVGGIIAAAYLAGRTAQRRHR